jgi:hypothetical protein
VHLVRRPSDRHQFGVDYRYVEPRAGLGELLGEALEQLRRLLIDRWSLNPAQNVLVVGT